MRDWCTHSLRDLVGSPISGARPPGGVREDTEGVPSLGGENILAGGGVTYDVVKRIPRRFYRLMPKGHLLGGDVLINKDGAQTGKVGFYDGFFDEAAVNEHLFILRSTNGSINRRLLYYYLLLPTIQAAIARRITGSAQPGLNSQFVDAIHITIPKESAEQKRIAEILSTVDEAIEQTEALIAKTQQIKAGLMHDLFTRGVTADGQLRPPREEAPQLYKESPLGWIPKEWNVVPSCEKLAVIDPQPDHRTPPAVPEGYPYVGTGDVTATGEIDFERARKVSLAAFEKQLRSFAIHQGAFIFGKIGTIGQPTRIPHERFFAVSANVVLLTSPNIDDSNYSYWHFQSALTDKQVADATNTTSQPALGIQKVRQFLLAWPPSDVERAIITARLESIATVLASETREKEKLGRVKVGLMQDLLTGRVPVAADVAAEPKEVAANV